MTLHYVVDLMPACSHFRAVEYYAESLQGCNFFTSSLCTDPYDIPVSSTAHRINHHQTSVLFVHLAFALSMQYYKPVWATLSDINFFVLNY